MRRDPTVSSLRTAGSSLVLGLILLLVAGVTGRAAFAGARVSPEETNVTAPLAPQPPDGPGPLTLRGPGDVAVTTVVYEPGQSSGWHAHGGLHAVAVLSGELTVYDRQCRPQRVTPGAPYVGGQELHLARNETGQPVDMIVTYLNAATPVPSDATRPVAPEGCAVSGGPGRTPGPG